MPSANWLSFLGLYALLLHELVTTMTFCKQPQIWAHTET